MAPPVFRHSFGVRPTWEGIFKDINLQKLFLFFSILFKEESIQKNNFFILEF